MSFAFERSRPLAHDLMVRALSASPQRLDWGALAVAALLDETVEVAAVEAKLDGLAARVAAARTDGSLPASLDALKRVLAEEEGLGGESKGEEALHSSIAHALDKKVGLPITLSVIYVEVARRAGIPLHGISFPGHFLVGADIEGSTRVLDPYNGAATLRTDDLTALLRRVAPLAQLSTSLLAAAPTGAVLARMLNNLKRLYLTKSDGESALRVVDLLLVLAPDHPGELRGRAAILSALGAYKAALQDVELCLKLSPQASDATNLAAAAKALRHQVSLLN